MLSVFQLLHIDPEKRLSNLAGMKQHKYLQDMDFSKILQRQIKPAFVPSVRFSTVNVLKFRTPKRKEHPNFIFSPHQ